MDDRKKLDEAIKKALEKTTVRNPDGWRKAGEQFGRSIEDQKGLFHQTPTLEEES